MESVLVSLMPRRGDVLSAAARKYGSSLHFSSIGGRPVPARSLSLSPSRKKSAAVGTWSERIATRSSGDSAWLGSSSSVERIEVNDTQRSGRTIKTPPFITICTFRSVPISLVGISSHSDEIS
jgi:hypothetical protein